MSKFDSNRKYEEKMKAYHAAIARLAEQAWVRYTRCVTPLLYLAGTRDVLGRWSMLVIASDDDIVDGACVTMGATLMHGQHIPRSMTQDQLYWHIKAVVERLPLAMFAD